MLIKLRFKTVSDEELKNHDGQAQDTKKQETPGQKQPETEGSKTSDEETSRLHRYH